MDRVMLSTMSLVALAGFLTVCLGAPLCTPDQWEGIQIKYAGYGEGRHRGTIREHTNVYYDAKNKRTARFLQYVNGDIQVSIQQVFIFGEKSGKLYEANLKTGVCITRTILEPFRKRCLPDDAKLVDSFVIGMKSNGIPASIYFSMNRGRRIHSTLMKAGENVIPIAEDVSGLREDVGFFENIQFADITPGISNTSVYDIPKECKSAQEIFGMEKYHIFA